MFHLEVRGGGKEHKWVLEDQLGIAELAKEVGNSRRSRKKQQLQEIFRELNQPHLLTYLAFGGIRKRKIASCETG